jgi:uncharacterized protein YjeT (DUF2065 family)
MELLLRFFMYLVGILWIIVGALTVFATDMIKKKFIDVILPKVNLKKVAYIPLIIGALLILAAQYNKHAVLVVLLGLIGILKGVLCIVRTDMMEALRNRVLKFENNAYRIFGVVMIIIGSIVLMGI